MSANNLQRKTILAAHGVSAAESALLHAVTYYNNAAQLPNYAAGKYSSLDEPVTEADCQDALASCLAKGWLRIIDLSTLVEIVRELERDGVFGPVFGLPAIGAVEFTWTGVRLWQQLLLEMRDGTDGTPFWCSRTGAGKRELYCRNLDTAKRESASLLRRQENTVSEPEPIGPWRVQWWRRYEQGFRFSIDSSYMGDTVWRLKPPTNRRPSLLRLKCILEGHQLSLGEWLILAGIDSHHDKRATHFADRVAASAARQQKITLAKEVYKNSLASCLRKGWIQVLDDKSLSSMRALLAADATLTPFRDGLGRVGEVDFTQSGATLYQTINTAYLGSDWDAGIFVENLCSWKELHYSESKERLDEQLREHARRGARVLSVEIKPMELWCSRWWERYPCGYRLEAEFAG